MNAKQFFFYALIILFVGSCNRDDNSVSESDRAQNLLGQWEYQTIETDRAVDINGDGTVNIDLFNTQEMRQCIKDNLTFFTEMGDVGSGTYTINENGLACDEQAPFSNVDEDNYKLVGDSIIQFDGREEMRIIELSNAKLVIEKNDNLGGEEVIVTITYKKG